MSSSLLRMVLSSAASTSLCGTRVFKWCGWLMSQGIYVTLMAGVMAWLFKNLMAGRNSNDMKEKGKWKVGLTFQGKSREVHGYKKQRRAETVGT